MATSIITFKFSMDETITTPLDEIGFIQCLTYSKGTKKYLVKVADGFNVWYTEDQLKPHIKPLN